MFIMTNINVPNDLIRVYDSTDGSNDVIRLSTAIDQVKSGKLVIQGISFSNGFQDSTPLKQYGVFISYIEARQAMANLYISRGVAPQEAYRRVGLA